MCDRCIIFLRGSTRILSCATEMSLEIPLTELLDGKDGIPMTAHAEKLRNLTEHNGFPILDGM